MQLCRSRERGPRLLVAWLVLMPMLAASICISPSPAWGSTNCVPFETTTTTSTTLAPSLTTTSSTTSPPYCVQVMTHDVEQMRAELLLGLALLVLLSAASFVVRLVR